MDRSCSARYVGYTGYWCYAADLHAHSMKPKVAIRGLRLPRL